jgi:hypothetical protein
MSKNPATVIKNTANSPFMMKIRLDNDIDEETANKIVFDFVYNKTFLSLYDFVNNYVENMKPLTKKEN